ncbi:Chaperone protein dnaJ [Giardia duodenalis]|uniref:Chaperone protein dnaJ n=1 Tax=Giardia intestinalis TaxID=5741 RepID=V6TEI6_GIAIN|nr:Chaperone protein dnaJ [Giardia intestinalis]
MLWTLLPVLLSGAVWAVQAATDDPAARASAAFKEGRYRDASDLYTSLIDAAQRPPAAYYFLRAASYEAQREIARAVDDYHKVLVLSQKQDVKAYAEKAKLKMGRLCLTGCSLQCSKKYSLALLDSATRTAIAKTDEQYRRAPSMTLAKLSELAETCSADPELSKIILVSQFRAGADISDIKKTIERLVKTTTAAPFTLRSVLEIYEIVYLLQEGNFSSVTKRAKAALQMDPDDQFLGSAYKIARALSEGVASFNNATPLSHKPNRTVIAKIFGDVDKAVGQIDKFFAKAESSAAFLLKDAFKTSFRPTLSGAKTQLMGALNNFRCISDLYFQKYTEEYCSFSDAMLVDTSKDLRISSFNKHLLALIYALRSNILLVSINNKYSRGQDIEDDVNLAEKIINYAHTLAIEANSPTQGDIETISDQVFTYVRKVIVPDFYKVLGVSRSTPIAEIKKKYYRLAKEYHPDYTPADATEEEKAVRQRKFQRIAEAWSVLSDETKRKEYDSGQYRREELESREQAHQRRKMAKANQGQQQETFHFHTGGNGNQHFFRFNGDDHQFFRFMNGQQFFRM